MQWFLSIRTPLSGVGGLIMKRFWSFLALAAIVLGITLAPFVLSGCGEEKAVTGPELFTPADSLGTAVPQAVVGPPWESYIVSEIKYMLCEQRTGTSHAVYQGLAMGDWDYPHSDAQALQRIIANYGSSTGPLGLWRGQYRQVGWCKFAVDMALYRSSYGYPSGHLFLKTGYSWSPWHPYTEAQPGWILQSSSLPHTAIVIAVLSYGLDVIDSNWVGTYYDQNAHQWVYSYALARHVLTWNQLSTNGFRAYRAHEICRIVS